jgi:ABC-2 type transport system permease protein
VCSSDLEGVLWNRTAHPVAVGFSLVTFIFMFNIVRGGTAIGQTLVVFAVYFVLGFLLFGSLMAGIGALSTTVRDSQNLVTIVTLPAAVPFFFLTVFVEEPNGRLAVALSLFPLTGPLSMVMRIAVTDVPLVQIALGLVLQVLAVIFAIWLAGRLFRVNTLLMGNMPKLRDLPRLVRG